MIAFADTFYWIALTNKRDSGHRAVLTEFLACCASDEMLRGVAGHAVSRLISDPDIRVIPQSRASFLAGLTLYNALRLQPHGLHLDGNDAPGRANRSAH